MNEPQSVNNSTSEPGSRFETRRQRRDARHAVLGGGGGLAWGAGALLVVLGAAFLMQNMGWFFFPFKNWWALIILLPALGAFEVALRAYKNNGNRLVATARGSLLTGTVLTLVTAIFLFEFDWTYFGPVLIILAGIGILFNTLVFGKE